MESVRLDRLQAKCSNLRLQLEGILNDGMTPAIVHCELSAIHTESTEHYVNLLALLTTSHSGFLCRTLENENVVTGAHLQNGNRNL